MKRKQRHRQSIPASRREVPRSEHQRGIDEFVRRARDSQNGPRRGYKLLD